jgi:hypothetical protein
MVKTNKREQKIRRNTRNVSLVEFEWLINQYGYIKAGGNHPIAIIGKEAYPYPRTNPVRRSYVKGLLALIDKKGE